MNPYRRKTTADVEPKRTLQSFDQVKKNVELLLSDVDDLRTSLAKIAEHLDPESTPSDETDLDVNYEVEILKEIAARFLKKHYEAVASSIERL